MSYTVVPTVATGDVWTASNHNLYIRDNFRVVIPDVVTAKGDLVIGAGANALAVLGIGNDGDIFQGDITWCKHTELLNISASNSTDIMGFASSGSGNLHIPTAFDVTEGANWIYCSIEFNQAATTAYFALYPSYDTTIEGVRVDAFGAAGDISMTHGIMPLDSTGGLFYNITDTSSVGYLRVYAWMY